MHAAGVAGAFAIGAAVTASNARLFLTDSAAWTLTLVFVAAGAAGLLAIGSVAARRRLSLRRTIWMVVAVSWVIVAVLALLNAATGAVTLQGYGDANTVVILFHVPLPLTRWLVGFALQQRIFAALAGLPGLTVDGFIRLSGIVVAGIATGAVCLRWPRRLSIVFCTLVPLWFLFAAGYLEYYPMVAWVVPAYLGWLYVEPTRFEERSPYLVGAVAGTLPLLYAGFTPLGIFLAVAYLTGKPRDTAKVAAAAVVAFGVVARVCWPGHAARFLHELGRTFTFSNASTFPRYRGHYERGSDVFHAGYALSPEHLLDLLYMYLFGGGLLFLPVLAAGALALARLRPWRALSAAERRLALLALALVGFHLSYMLFFVPRLGPRGDVDLFFTTFLIVAFFAGHVVDRLIDLGRVPERWALLATALVVGSLAVVLPPLAFHGLPVRS